ncbi:hypothetical protein PRZ48_010073 [Zasmidium cellare]|uniref:Thiaminase-2/PQQC domain-containing protein n=1 Tax=Zasmidium cellare TaxID=395010 RepID=A0ABR0EE46_ZASCE|nr:hypothetical protein PRZ48_010073 [Zasmidium cellare]
MPSLTAHLVKIDEPGLQKATTHPFLSAAATSSLQPHKLKQWLAQDRLYALSYTNFIGTLLAQVSIPTGPDRETTIEWRIADALIDCLNNIRNEVKMFEEAAAAEGFLEEICSAEATVPARSTRSYQDLFAGSLAQGRPLIVGLTVLWATEECYLRAWRHAWSKMDQSLRPKDRDVMQRVFVPNWSSPEFEAFVRRLGGLVNKMAIEWGVEEDGWVWKECEAAFRQVLWVEADFWPNVDEDGHEVKEGQSG